MVYSNYFKPMVTLLASLMFFLTSCDTIAPPIVKLHSVGSRAGNPENIVFKEVAHRGGNWQPAKRSLSNNGLLPVVAATAKIAIEDATGSHHFCTGFLIDSDKVMTSNHCVEDDQIAKPIRSIHGYFGAFRGSENVDIYQFTSKPGDRFRQLDIAILRGANLNSSLPGEAYGYLAVSDKLILPGQKMHVVHFPGKDQVVSNRNCVAIAVEPSRLVHSCDTAQGSSGAPIVDQAGQVVAVHTGGNIANNYGSLPRPIATNNFTTRAEAYRPTTYANLTIEAAKSRATETPDSDGQQSQTESADASADAGPSTGGSESAGGCALC